ncbi:hypothetical protein ACHAWF_005613 [Thalassiosira exigua]
MNRQRQRKRQWKSWSLGDVGGDGDSGDCSDNAERKLSRESLDGRDDPTRRRERERPTIGFVAGATDSRRDNDSTGSRPRHRGHPKSLSSSYTAGEDRSAGLPQRRHGKVSSSFTAGCEHHSLDNFKDPSAEDFRASAAAERAGRRRPSHTRNSSRSLFGIRSEHSGGSAGTDPTSSIAGQRQLDSSLRRLSLDDDGGRPSGLRSKDAKAEEAYIRETERTFKGESSFEERVIGEAKDLESSIRLLRQTRAISALGSRLTAASDEDACVEEVARLLALMFGVESVSFAVPTDPEHFVSKRFDVVRTNADGSSFDLRHSDGDGRRRRLEGTAEGACIRSLREHYAPRTGDSPFEAHAALHRDGMNAALATPVLVDAGRCAGCIVLAREAEDGFGEAERALIGDVGALLGANVHAKRRLKDAEETKRRSREMLHSFCHPKVLKKIECYWDADSDEYKSRKSASSDSPEEDASMTADSTGSNASEDDDDGMDPHLARSEVTDADVGAPQRNGDGPAEGGVKEKIRLWKSMEGAGDGGGEDDALMFDTSAMDFAPTSRALYAESAENGELGSPLSFFHRCDFVRAFDVKYDRRSSCRSMHSVHRHCGIFQDGHYAYEDHGHAAEFVQSIRRALRCPRCDEVGDHWRRLCMRNESLG